MADISMCVNCECPLKSKCYRYTAPPNEYRQVYMGFTFKKINGKIVCNDFIDNGKGDKNGKVL